MKDVTGAEICEVRIRHDGKVVWVNVDGMCVCRVCRINKLVLEDDRRRAK